MACKLYTVFSRTQDCWFDCAGAHLLCLQQSGQRASLMQQRRCKATEASCTEAPAHLACRRTQGIQQCNACIGVRTSACLDGSERDVFPERIAQMFSRARR